MRPQPFEEPRLFVVKAADLRLSGPALLELMRAVLAKGRPFRFCARGWSMAPFIRDGDVITVSPLHVGRPRIGEVVAFVRPEAATPVVHRVVGHRGAAAIIQGDSAPSATPQEVIPPQNLLGRVTRVERKGRSMWLGLGLERYAIAWLSRAGLLVPLRAALRSLLGRRG